MKQINRWQPSSLRRLTVTAALAVTLSAFAVPALVVPAHAATTADPAPTGVTVAWADAAHTLIRVTWKETGSQPNVITSQSPLGGSEKRYTTATAPNQVDVPAAGLATTAPGQAAVRIAVFVGTEAGGTTSPAGLSAPFDTLDGPKALIDSIAPVAAGKFLVKWHPAVVTDPNPGDPLDLPAVAPQYEIRANYNNFNDYAVVAPKTTATTATFTQLTGPSFRFSVFTYNEWGIQYSDTQRIDYEKWVRALIPAAADYGTLTTITGTIERWKQACDPGPCWSMPMSEDPRPVVLQARATTASAWYTVGSTKTDAVGNFKISPPTLGSRQYRIVVPDFFNHEGFGYGLVSNTVTTAARPRVSGRFLDPTAGYGQKVTAHVAIAPPASVPSTLQRWDGTAWRNLKYVQLTKGAGNYTFTATQRGRVAYRFLVPAFTYAGRSLTWQVSNTFVLTTS
ncbi:hypothetical protein EV138_6766 [Kribbella voronezhensis]|uniref:Carboxypeptidase family protein n=1 Tax=Kribbella voronezhensis TaxID=2512212 RepID=A0A4R7SZ21_9ACTN|nr:hypothetical protein [Kribbella voronezhensis]TDU84295.1 hypothetical protein EV138_6766 [Kribbella voronezhensis]